MVLWLGGLHGRGPRRHGHSNDRFSRQPPDRLGHSADDQEHAFRGQGHVQARHGPHPERIGVRRSDEENRPDLRDFRSREHVGRRTEDRRDRPGRQVRWRLQQQMARCRARPRDMSRRKRTSGAGRNIPQSIDTTVNPNALSGGFGFFQDQEFTRDNYKADLTTFFGGHSVKGGIDFEHIKAVNQNFNGGAGQRIYKLRTSADVDLLPPPVLHRRPRSRLRPGRSDYLGVRRTSGVRAGLAESRVVRAGQLARGLEPDHQRRDPLGRSGRQVARQRIGLQADRQLGAAHRVRLGRGAEPARASCTRTGAASSRASRWTSTSARSAERCRASATTSARVPTTSSRIPTPHERSRCSAARSPSIRISRDSTSTSSWLDSTTKSGRRSSSARSSRKRDLGRVIEDFLIPSEGNYFIANPASGIGKRNGVLRRRAHGAGARSQA